VVARADEAKFQADGSKWPGETAGRSTMTGREHLTPARRRRVGIRLQEDSYSNGINRLPQISNASLTARATNRRRKRQWLRVARNRAVGNDVFGSRLELVTGLSGSPDMQIAR